MAKSENWEKGTKVRRQLLGEGAVQAMSQDVYNDPIMEKFGDYAREAVFGMLWTRPGLDMKTRALICIVSDTAIHAWPELAVHMRMARRMGWSEDELIEALMHMNGYVGLPTVREAMIVARDLFAKMRAEPDGGLGE
ncbi:carboxymuconolactone decarboxylase family protein [Rhodovarius sp.]|jgi:4-carboxymuconolactone decarboxylase|uniref:carboxymuconolactone decarboxylase family protein n=1 Tax=Rhodovarius sp. TaxID=2972673 RepID=UPI00333F155E